MMTPELSRRLSKIGKILMNTLGGDAYTKMMNTCESAGSFDKLPDDLKKKIENAEQIKMYEAKSHK